MRHKELFYSKIIKTNDCWLWSGILGKSSLPIFIVNKKEYSAKKYSLLIIGKDSGKNKIFNTCNEKSCVNPDHLLFGDEYRFWNKVQKLDNGCWIWIASEDKNGYGKFCIIKNGKQIDIRAHRYSWELFSGRKIPASILVCHKCDNTRCVNPNHLFLGTNLDNMTDRDQKGRANTPIGSRSSFSKLTEKEVIEIRLSKLTIKELAKIYNLHKETIRNILNRKIWKHI